MRSPILFPSLLLLSFTFVPASAFADPPPPPGTPPPDEKTLVAAPKPVADAPKAAAPGTDTTSATVSAGGQLATGNSRLLAMTANAKFDMRRGDNGFGAAFIGNYGETATGPGRSRDDDDRELPGAPPVRPLRARRHERVSHGDRQARQVPGARRPVERRRGREVHLRPDSSDHVLGRARLRLPVRRAQRKRPRAGLDANLVPIPGRCAAAAPARRRRITRCARSRRVLAQARVQRAGDVRDGPRVPAERLLVGQDSPPVPAATTERSTTTRSSLRTSGAASLSGSGSARATTTCRSPGRRTSTP